MKKSKYTESQIIGILKQQEAGAKVVDLCREQGISQPTFYNWKSKYGGMEVSQLKRIKELERELSQYKKMYAEEALANRVLKDVISKKL
jgi:putative transposase